MMTKLTFKTNPAIQRFSQVLDMDYPLAVGIYVLLDEMDENGILNDLSDERVTYELGFMSRELSHELSQKCHDIREAFCHSKRYGKRIQDRDRQREYRSRKKEREALPPDGPSSPTPPISPLPPTEIKNNNINNAHTRERLPRRRFVRPTHDELAAYAKELGYDGFDAGRFMDYYDANGWTVGKDKPMKDWKAAVRTWKRNDDERRGVKPVAERERDTDEDVFAGLTEEQIEEYRRLARDGKHWG